MFGIKNKIYFAGGYSLGQYYGDPIPQNNVCSYYPKQFWEFDTDQRVWTQKDDLPMTLSGDCYLELNSADGFGFKENGYAFFEKSRTGGSSVWRYDVIDGSWHHLGTGAGRDCLYLLQFRDYLFIGNSSLNFIERYPVGEINGDNVRTVPLFGTDAERNNVLAFSINDKGYFLNETGAVWEYFPKID